MTPYPGNDGGLFAELINGVPASLVVFDDELTVQFVGGKAVKSQSHDPAEIEGRTITELMPPDQATRLSPMYRAALDGKPQSARYVSGLDGLEYELLIRPIPGGEGRTRRAVAVSLEADPVLGAERRDWSLFRRVFEDVTVGFAVATTDGVVVEANPGWARIVGKAAEDLRERNLEEFASGDGADRVRDAVAALAEGAESPIDLEIDVARDDGTEVHCRLSLSRARGSYGSAVSITAQIQDVTERKLQEQRLRHMAEHDPLTDLLNRRAFEHRLAERLRGARRGDRHSAMLLCDLDGLKQINDQFGHVAGDDALTSVAEALRATVRKGDAVGRVGGDEFAILAATHDLEALGSLAERLRSEVSDRSRRHGVPLSVSIGVALLTPGISDRELWRRADRAMYGVKGAGKGDGVEFWSADLERVPREGLSPEKRSGGPDQEVGPGDEQGEPPPV